MSVIEKIEKSRLFGLLLKVESMIMIISSILAAGIVFVGVVMRYVLKMNFFGQEEILCVVAMWLYWFGGVYGSFEGSHIKGDMLSTVFKSPRSKKIIELVIQGVSFVVILVFCIWGFEYMSFNLKFHAVSTGLKIPLVYSQLPLLIGFLLMELYTVFNFFRVLLDPGFGKPPEAPPSGGEG